MSYPVEKLGGAKRDRTADLLHAMRVVYSRIIFCNPQNTYITASVQEVRSYKFISKFSNKIELLVKVARHLCAAPSAIGFLREMTAGKTANRSINHVF